MARRGAPRDRNKERFWRRLLRRWRRSGRTVRAFCAEHGVSEPSFFAWRRTIAERDQRYAVPSPALPTGADDDAPHQATANSPTFVPVRVVPMPEPVRSFEVVLNDDRVVRVPAGFDPASLRQLLAILHEERLC